MALQAFSVRRAQDPVLAVAVVSEIVPKNWHKFPPATPVGGYPPAYVRTNTWNGGAYGSDVDQSTTNVLVDDLGRGDYAPRTQAAKATALGTTLAQDVTSPRGWVDPSEPYGPAPVSPADDPTISSLAPSTAVSGGAAPIWVTITGTKFTQYSSVETGNVYTPYHKYISPTKMAVLMDPRSSPGTITVKVIDHGVKSAAANFTFT